jgi:hypothetical protein
VYFDNEVFSHPADSHDLIRDGGIVERHLSTADGRGHPASVRRS